ncbi:MAG: outer membrane protein assembly factor BamA [Pseudomonadota bacterium]
MCRFNLGSALAAILVAVFLILPGSLVPAHAQFRFTNFVIEGNQRVDPGTVLSYSELRPGQSVSTSQLNQASQDIRASGLFETVELEPRGSTLVIRVEEFPTINQIAIEGNRRLDDDELLPLLRSSPRRVYSPTQAEQDAANIIGAYEEQGYLAASVTPRIIRRSDNRVDLVFEVAEGRVVENERVSFVGNREYSDRRLRRVLETKQAGLLRRFFRTDTFIADRIEFDRRVLRDFYLSRGYIDFQILDVSAELSRERNATFITFQVREGQQFSIGSVTATSTYNGADAAEFLAAGRLRENVVYSPILIENAITRMEGLATQKGLDFVRIEPRVTRNERALTLDIEFEISRGERIFVERIDIEGNQTTLDRVIRRQFRSVEGDPFNPREIRNAATRIRALNYFSNVNVQSREGSGPDQVVIDVDVEEEPTGSLGVGGSYSTDGGIGVAVSFSERNFLGRGQQLSFELNTTDSSSRNQISFTEPYLFGRDLSLTLAAFLNTEEDDSSDFSSESIGASIGLGFPVGEYSRLNVSYTYNQRDLFDVSTDSSPILQAEARKSTKSAIAYNFVYDTRRGGLDPNAGVLLSFGQEFAGLGGDVDFIKTTARAVAQRRLRNEDYTLRATLEGGTITPLNDYVTTVNDRFFLRSSQLRGFEFRGVGPRDTAAVNQDALGGNNYVLGKLEFGFPIGFAEELGVSGGLFVDAGSVWGLQNTDGAGGPGSVDDSFSLRSSVGFSLFWETPLGPLTFNFSEQLKSEDFDRERTFDVTVTARF